MIKRIAATVAVSVLLLAPAMVLSTSAAAPQRESFLFTVEAASAATESVAARAGEDERFTLVMRRVAPVTKFSDRPFRDAMLISPKSLASGWQGWFADSAPNAVLTWQRHGRSPASMVVTLTTAKYSASERTLTFDVVRVHSKHDPANAGPKWERLSTPSTMTGVSLFIDEEEEEEEEEEE